MRKLAFEALMPAKQFADAGSSQRAISQMTQQIRSQLKAEGALTKGNVRLSVMVTCLADEPIEVAPHEAIN